MTTWAAVNNYFYACWSEFSVNELSNTFADDVQFVHKRNDGEETIIDGKKAVLKWYRDRFFSNVNINTTRLYNFNWSFERKGRVRVSFVMRQNYDDFVEENAHLFGMTVNVFDVDPETDKITRVSMTSQVAIDSIGEDEYASDKE